VEAERLFPRTAPSLDSSNTVAAQDLNFVGRPASAEAGRLTHQSHSRRFGGSASRDRTLVAAISSWLAAISS